MGLLKGIKNNILKKISICRIDCNNGMINTGFFCLIPLSEDKVMKAIVTTNVNLEDNELEKDIIIKIPINNNKEEKIIVLDKERIKYINNKFGIIIIEIKDSDGIKNDSFLEIDLGNKISVEQNIYLLYYSKGIGICYSEGKIEEEFEENKSLISYSCNSRVKEPSDGILINESNNKIIGINLGFSRLSNEKGISLKEAVEDFKNKINYQKENEKSGTIIQRITSLDEFEKCYDTRGYEIYRNKEYTINISYTNISKKKFVLKTYYDFSKKYFHLIREEQVALSKIQNNFVIKLKDYYISENKSILVFDSSLKDIIKNFKHIYPLNRIQQFLTQINEIIKELDKYHINDIIFSPENLCFYCGGLKLINLFPFYKLIKDNKVILLTDSLKYINPKIHNSDKKEHILFNIGALMYEMHFGELPYVIICDENNYYSDIKFKKLKSSSSRDFNDLIKNLLNIDKNNFTWNDYINSSFLKSIPPQKKFEFLYQRYTGGYNEKKYLLGLETKDEPKVIDLSDNEISKENLLLLSKIDLNNLIMLDLSNNRIENIEFINSSLKNLKILSLEDNNLKNLDLGKELSNIKDLEYLFVNSNNIENINFFSKNLIYLTHLSLFNNKISDLSSMKNCSFPNLEILNLSFNKITDISDLCKADMKFLKELYLFNNKINNINDLQNAFPLLEILNLENNSIFDINIFNKILFSNTIKELCLYNNPISKYEELNFTYFPSIQKINLGEINKTNENLLWITMKVQLFGYELFIESSNEKNEIIIEANDKISILFIPESHIYNYKDLEYFDKTRIFKIIANSNITLEKLESFFVNNILKLPNKIFDGKNFISDEKGNKNVLKTKKINNYSIFFYDDKNDIIIERIESNIINLANEYKNTHEIRKNYYKIPGYLEEQKNIPFSDISCVNSEYKEDCYKNIPHLIADKKYKNYELLDLLKSNYFLKLPLVYYNARYQWLFKKFLNNYNKYKDFKKYDDIFLKYFLKEYYSFKHHHEGNFKNDSIFAMVIENTYIDYFSEEYFKLISEIKKKNINYKKFINDWIINIFEIMVDFILFVLNKETFYYICPECKNPILFLYDNDKKIFNNNEIIINNKNKRKEPFLYKSLKISEKIFDLIINDTDDDFFDDNENIQMLKKLKLNELKILANPPKKEKFINLIYLNDNPFNSIKSEIDELHEKTNGLFIFCNAINSFKNVIDLITDVNNNEENCKFCLITNGRCFRNAINYIETKGKIDIIQRACIFCFNDEIYMKYLNEYDFLEGIYTSIEEVLEFIENNSSSDTKIYRSLKIITYDKYEKKYYKMHQMIAKYYRVSSNDNNIFTIFYQRVKEEIENFRNKKKLEEIFQKFNNITDSQNSTALIKDYTGNHLYPVINNWLLDLENWTFENKKIIKNIFRMQNKKNDNSLSYEKNAYFVGQLMYRLNFKIIEDKNNNNPIYNNENLELYRGIHIDFIESFIYPLQIGKIISFGTFISTSKQKNVAIDFSTRNKKIYDYSIVMTINVRQNKALFPMFFKIKDSYYNHEEEFLFPPFTFFKLTNFSFDYENTTLNLYLEVIGKRSILENELTEKNRLKYDEKNNIMNFIINKEKNGDYYIGDLLNGQKNGKGILYNRNNIIKFEGDFINGTFQGNGRYNLEGGEYYEGQWLNGKRNGRGILYYSNGKVKYEGDFINDKYQGSGRYNWEDGKYYIGQWLNGERNGKGIVYYKNNSIKYSGDFVNDEYQGNGIYNWEDGEYYDGQWLNNLRHGKGIMYYKNGNIKYEGYFINGKYQGDGRYNWEDGKYYIGQWLNGLKHGKGILCDEEGNVKYEGDFVKDKYEGKGKFVLESGNYYIGDWLNGVRHGRGAIYDENDNLIYECTFENDNLLERSNNCYIY